MSVNRIRVSSAFINTTLASFRTAGARNAEGVVLWLGRQTTSAVEVLEVYVPAYKSERDFFWIPRESMAALLEHLGATNSFIAAQVHSHPQEAFHSIADDQWAIVRHRGALSLVVPRFARETSVSSFIDDIAAFSLNENNIWTELSHEGAKDSIEIVP